MPTRHRRNSVPGLGQVLVDVGFQRLARGMRVFVPLHVMEPLGVLADYDRDVLFHQSLPLPSGRVIVKLEMAIVSPAVIEVVFMIMSAELVPQVPRAITVPLFADAWQLK